MDIHVNTIYLIDAKPYESKQCRYEIESTGLLPDEPMTQRKGEKLHAGEPPNLGLGLAVSSESIDLNAMENNALKSI